MVNLREWVLKNLIDCVNHKIFAKEYASILATNYLLKGILNQEDIQIFDEATKEPEPVENDTVNDTVDTAEETEQLDTEVNSTEQNNTEENIESEVAE